MRTRSALVWLIVGGCGRVGFAPLGDGGRGGIHPFGDDDGSFDAARDGAGADGAAAGDSRFVQAAGGTMGAGSTAVSATFPSPVAAGDLIVFGISVDGNLPNFTITDTLPGIPAKLQFNTTTLPLNAYFGYYLPSASGTETIDVAMSATNNTYLDLQAWDFSGSGATYVSDRSALAAGTSTATDGARTMDLTTTHPNELMVAWGAFVFTGEAGTGFSEISDYDSDPAEARLLATPGTYSPTLTMDSGGTNWTVVAATFRTQ